MMMIWYHDLSLLIFRKYRQVLKEMYDPAVDKVSVALSRYDLNNEFFV